MLEAGMLSTEAWAKSFGIPVEATPPEAKDCASFSARSAHDIAARALILQCVVAAAAGADPDPIIDWLTETSLWPGVTFEEKAFLREPSQAQQLKLGWHCEAEWTLLWTIGKVEALGLPTALCDSKQLCDGLMPPPGSDIAEFLAAATLRPPGVLLAEDDRTYDLWCHALAARRNATPLPNDLNWNVLYERRYAFEWLDGMQEWDGVTCDA